MVRSFLLWIKHLCYALVVLALLGCLTEIGLRVYDSASGQITRRDLYDRAMVCKSWFVHHTLKPSHSYGVKNPDSGEKIKITLNSLGLRGPEPALPKPAGVFRVVCLGDDTTFAPQVPDADCFSTRLQGDLQPHLAERVEVINAGIPEYCPLLSYLQVRHQLLALEADLWIVNFDMSDVGDDYTCRRHAVVGAGGVPVSCAHPALEMPRSSGKARQESPFLLPQFVRQRIGALLADPALGEKSKTIGSARSRYLWLEDQPPDWSVYISQTLLPIQHLLELVHPSGASVIVVCCPAPWQVAAGASNGGGVRERAGVGQESLYRSRRPFELVDEFCRSHEIPCCDLSVDFQKSDQPERLYLKNAAAFSSTGHALVARDVAQFIADRLNVIRPPTGQPATPAPRRAASRWPESIGR